MVSIDSVYQKVLALANKEQRGYITPQEFNLFADLAQKEIFEQYFYDINQFRRIPGNNHEFSDPLKNLDQKISIFEKYDESVVPVNSYSDMFLPNDVYRVGMIRVKYRGNPKNVIAEKIDLRQLMTYLNAPLTKPNKMIGAYYTQYPTNAGENRIKIYPTVSQDESVDRVRVSYIRKPVQPKWTYVVINDKPIYNGTNAIDFELHQSEESELVYRILVLAGIAIEKPQLTQSGAQLASAQIQQEKS
jgi:hypothetical protein